jgi:hypothetical protein
LYKWLYIRRQDFKMMHTARLSVDCWFSKIHLGRSELLLSNLKKKPRVVRDLRSVVFKSISCCMLTSCVPDYEMPPAGSMPSVQHLAYIQFDNYCQWGYGPQSVCCMARVKETLAGIEAGRHVGKERSHFSVFRVEIVDRR